MGVWGRALTKGARPREAPPPRNSSTALKHHSANFPIAHNDAARAVPTANSLTSFYNS